MLKTLNAPKRRKQIRVGPADDGRAMSLADFDQAEGQEGFNYELARGIIQVTNIPSREHSAQMIALRNQLIVYEDAHPKIISAVGGSFDTKMLIGAEQSERHPDLSVYLSPMPEGDDLWSIWIPAIAVEIVSESSAKRDYEEKPAEYLAFGVMEYWIVDGFKNQMTVMSRYRGAWREKIVKPSQKYVTSYLPGFSLDLKRVLSAGK
jgi:Uma2 family endonuclease